MHLKSNSIEIMIGNKTDEIIEDIFDSLLQKHQIDLKESTKGSKFVLDGIDVLPYRYRKMNLNCGRSYIDYCFLCPFNWN